MRESEILKTKWTIQQVGRCEENIKSRDDKKKELKVSRTFKECV